MKVHCLFLPANTQMYTEFVHHMFFTFSDFHFSIDADSDREEGRDLLYSAKLIHWPETNIIARHYW